MGKRNVATKLGLTLALAGALAGCGGGSGGGSASPAAAPSQAAQIAAAQQTAASNAACATVAPFYFEIGDKNGTITGGPVGGNLYSATTKVAIASGSKWLFGAYVAETRGGVLAASDVQATHMQSGYVSQSDTSCTSTMTVSSCFSYGTNSTYTPASLGRFYYNGGHFQKWGVDNGLGALTGPQLASQYQAVLGADIPVIFNIPLVAGGAIMSASDYAIFLRKILNNQLKIAGLLGYQKTCTLPGACATADYSPIPVAWDYSVGHWVEDDPASGDGAYSSAGAFGFYPWIDSTKTYYGILARMDQVTPGAGYASAQCGGHIRKAFVTGVAQ